MLALFERPILPGWIYPCSLADIRAVLDQLPQPDLHRLTSVSLVPSTRKACLTNGRYLAGPPPTIQLFSHPDNYRHTLPASTRAGDVNRSFEIERRYGMNLEYTDSRWICVWQPEQLRAFIARHVLPHEVGHHVHGITYHNLAHPERTHRNAAEYFAESYALRHSPSIRLTPRTYSLSPP